MVGVDWKRASWFIAFPGIADAYLWDFEVDGRWWLGHDNPARGTLAIMPIRRRGRRATFREAVWIADCIAFDHDAPIGVFPSASNLRTSFPHKPVVGMPTDGALWYFDDLLKSFYAAAEIRFGESYCVRYDLTEDHPPTTDFTTRFVGKENLVRLYAMAARQPDVLSEYLCLYRLLEARGGSNGTSFIESTLRTIGRYDFGRSGAGCRSNSSTAGSGELGSSWPMRSSSTSRSSTTASAVTQHWACLPQSSSRLDTRQRQWPGDHLSARHPAVPHYPATHREEVRIRG